jgi:hypothetical protein
MISYARLVESVRRTRNTLYLVAGLYIVVGFVVAIATAMQPDPVGTFFGFLIITGALAMGLIARTALQVLVRIAHIEESLDDFADRVEALIPLVHANGRVSIDPEPSTEPVVDLADFGLRNPELLAAANLKRDGYPRLASARNSASEEPDTGAIESESTSGCKIDLNSPESSQLNAADQSSGNSANGVAASARNLLQQWKAALADDDLSLCRQIFSALLDLADRDALKPLELQICELEDRLERRLRDRFTSQVHHRDFVAALETGEQMHSLLSDRPVAADFERLRPILARRADEALTAPAATS